MTDKKLILVLLLVIIGLGGSSCYQDKGNYDYIPAEDVLGLSVEPLGDQRVPVGGQLTLEPVITGMDDVEQYDFAWYIFRASTETSQTDTISRQKDLVQVRITQPLGQYTLGYAITDRRLGLTHYETVSLEVVSTFSYGWMLLKDDNNQTDLDFVKLYDPEDSGGMRAEVFPDLFSAVNGYKLNGTAKQVAHQFVSTYGHTFYNEDGTIQSQVSRQPAIHLITSEDAATLNVENLSAYKRADGLFYRGAGPDALQPQAFDFGGSAAGFLAMVANGRLYHVTLPSTYCYLTPRAIDGSFDYKLADMLLTDEYYSGVIFNKTTSSVLFIDSNGNITTPANPANGYPHVNMNLDFIRFIDRNSMYYVRAFLLMAERDRSQYYLYNFYGFMTTAAPFANQEGESRIVLPASSALLKATASAGHPGRSVIYFSTGDHRLQMLTAAENPVENVVYTFDSSEKITSICTYTVKTFPNNYLDRFAVATTTADGGWKLYSFETDGVDLLPDPQVFSGTGGTVRSICYLP